MGVHHALGVAGGARCEEHGAHIIGLDLVHFSLEEISVQGCEGPAVGQERVQRGQTRLVVLAQTTRIVKIDVGELRALLADFQQLVDLLLVFGKCKTNLGVVDGEHALQRCRVLVQGNRNGTQGLRRQHRGIQTRPVGAHHNHVFPAAQTGLMQATAQMLHQRGQFSPRQGLPDAIFFLAHGRLSRALGGVI